MQDVIIGSWINTISPVAAEIMSSAGFDFLVVDAEHSSADFTNTQGLFQAIRAGNPDCSPMVRMPGNRYADTKRYLDAGAAGVIAPFVNTAEDARELVRSVKFPPEGDRGLGFGRSLGYGFAVEEYVAEANERLFIAVQIEHIKGVENLDSILAVEGIDAAIIGPYDLSASMGLTAQFDHPDYVKARNRILEGCREKGVRAGIHVVQPEPGEALERIREGYTMIAYSLDITMLGVSCRTGLKAIREGLGR
jgi:2-dehydro-3-deoxyglucarate aldolase